MTPPRISRPATLSAEAKAALAKTPREGDPGNLFGLLTHHPTLLKRFNAFAGTFNTQSLLDPREREATVLRTAALAASQYELSHHIEIARNLGFADAEILDIALGASDEYGLLLAVAEQLVTGTRVDDDTFQRLAATYPDAYMIELFMLVGSYRMCAGLLNSAGVELEEWADPSAVELASRILTEQRTDHG